MSEPERARTHEGFIPAKPKGATQVELPLNGGGPTPPPKLPMKKSKIPRAAAGAQESEPAPAVATRTAMGRKLLVIRRVAKVMREEFGDDDELEECLEMIRELCMR